MRRFVRLAAIVMLLMAGCAQRPSPAGPTAVASSPHDHYTAAPPAPLRAGEHFVRLSMPRPYTPAPPNGGTDEYRCFLLDPGITTRSFLTGSQFLPENPTIVHHAIFFRVLPGDVAQARQLDARDPGDGWTCFGGTGIGSGDPASRQLSGGGAWIAAWAPGGKESVLGNRTGYEMRPGSQIVMQIHYNLLATAGRATGTDQSGILLRITGNTTGLRALQTTLLPAPVELPCAANESGPLCDRDKAVLDVWQRFGPNSAAAVAGLSLLCSPGGRPQPGPTQHCDRKVRTAGTIYAVAGHMHLLGHSIKVELNPGTPGARVLLDVPVYNFDDQSARPVATPVTVKPGDTFRVTCTHDATLRQKLPQLKPLKPRYVVWGEGTSDEMCLGIVIWYA
jgi:hypothetical protein